MDLVEACMEAEEASMTVTEAYFTVEASVGFDVATMKAFTAAVGTSTTSTEASAIFHGGVRTESSVKASTISVEASTEASVNDPVDPSTTSVE